MNDVDQTETIDSLWSRLYPDLKRLARSRLRRSGPHTLLETTGLVNEAYIRVASAAALRDASPGAFMAYAARTMRSVVVDLIRESNALCRGGDMVHITLNTAIGDSQAADEPLQIDEALSSLAEVEPRLCQVVEMRYFAGFTEIEIGQALGVSDRTIRRDWTKACLLLRSMLDA